jgi:phenylalanyl-tRNA synthetase beta chain
MKLVPNMTVGRERPEEHIANLVRSIMTGMGFTEIMSLNLQSEESHFDQLGIPADNSFARVDNPKTVNQQMLRSHLLTGILETFKKNKKKITPQKIFEIGPTTLLDAEAETGIAEYRSLAFAVIGAETGYAEVRAVLDAVSRELGITGEYRAAEHPTFISGRFARVSIDNGLEAQLGEIHPNVLCNFGLAYPVSYCELRLAKVC